MRYRDATCLIALVLIALLSGDSPAAPVPETISFTARLADSGVAVTGSHSFIFALYPTASGGSEVWREAHYEVTVTGGFVSLELGAENRLDSSTFVGAAMFLEVTVDGTVMSPRLALNSVPYAMRAGLAGAADRLGAYAPGDFVTTVAPGSGLAGGGSGGNVSLSVNFSGSGAATTSARSDHDHRGAYLPAGTRLGCPAGEKVRGIEPGTGDILCGPEGGATALGGGAATGVVSTLTVRARSDCGAIPPTPRMEVYANQLLIGTVDVPNGAYADYMVPLPPPGATYVHEVAVAFVNDSAAGGCDHNLHVESISIGGQTIPATRADIAIYDRGNLFDRKDVLAATPDLLINGALRFFLAPPAIPELPSGMVAMFENGCPPGWVELSGLRNRFVRGWDGNAAGQTGGSDTHSHSYNAVIAHSHTVDPPAVGTSTDGNHAHGIHTLQDDYNVSGGSGPSWGADNGPWQAYHSTDGAGSHNHTVDIPSTQTTTTGSASATTSTDGNMPAYYTLVYCKHR